MSRLNLSPNLFLEVNELNRMIKFIEDDGYKRLMKCLVKRFGIAQNEDNTLFKVSYKSGSENTVLINAGIAFDSELRAIVLKEDKEIEIPYPSELDSKQWIVISHSSNNDEEGTVKISKQGVVSGSDTKFLEVLRGQPNFPTKIRFNSSINSEDYEVVEITSDTEAIISGDFTEESGLKYQVVGTFTPGFQPNDSDKTIYEYDSCDISIIESKDKPVVEDNSFIIASVYFDNGVNVDDLRIENLFNTEFKESNETNIEENPFVALRRTSIVNDKFLDIQFEWGFKVKRFKLVTTSTNNIFNIIDGESKYISDNIIPDGIFNGWLLVNRKNMMNVTIDNNNNKSLYISKFNPGIITGENDDFVVIPNFNNIEVEIKTTGTNYKDDDTSFFFRFSMENIRSRIIVPVEYQDTNVALKYRMFGNSSTTQFHNFAITKFDNISGEPETLGNSSFDITINRPEEVKRNYS